MIRKIISLFIFLNLIVAGSLYYFHVASQKEDLFFKISDKCLALGSSIINTIDSAVNLGIDLHDLNGTQSYLDKKLSGAKELDYIAITDENGKILFGTSNLPTTVVTNAFLKIGEFSQEGQIPRALKLPEYLNLPMPIKINNEMKGFINLGLSDREIHNRIMEIFFDIAMIVIASLIIGYEFISYLFLNSVIYPFREFFNSLSQLVGKNLRTVFKPRSLEGINYLILECNQITSNFCERFAKLKKIFTSLHHNAELKFLFNKLNSSCKWPNTDNPSIKTPKPIVYNVRLIAFLLILSEATLMPHLPSYAMRFYESSFSFSRATLGSFPVLAFMITATIGILINSKVKLAKVFGYRKVIIMGTIACAIGYLLLAVNESLLSLIVARCIIGIGFSICYVSYQGFVTTYASDEEKLSSFVIFLIAMGAGYMCGSPIGGIMIDNLGFKSAALIPLVSTIFSALSARQYINDIDIQSDQKEERANEKNINSLSDLFKYRSISYAVIFSGFPARFMYSSMLCFLYPLYLQFLGNSQSMVGRIMMIFGLMMFVFGPLSPFILRKYSNHKAIAITSSLIIGCTLLLDKFIHGTIGIACSVGVYTVSSAIHTAAMMSILDKEADKIKDKYSKEAVFSFYFLFERVAMIFGAPVTAFLLRFLDYTQTLFAIGVFVIIGSIIYAFFGKKRLIESAEMLEGKSL